MQEGERQQKPVYFCCGPTAHQRANAAVLVRHQHPIYTSRNMQYAVTCSTVAVQLIQLRQHTPVHQVAHQL